MELNLIYEQMREDNKIFEMKDGGIARRSSKDFNPEKKKKSSQNLQNANNSNSLLGNLASTGNGHQVLNPNPNPNPNPNSALFIKLKNENTEEIYVHYKNFINRLRMSE